MTDIKRAKGRNGQDGSSNPSWLDLIACSRSKEFLERKRQVEEGPYHPNEELLREYVLCQLDESDVQIITDHLSLCGPCARQALRLRWKLQDESESLWTKVSGFVSSLSLPVAIYAPALEPVRGTMADQERRYKPGTDLVLSIEAPDDGYVAVFHGCEETGKVELVFPVEPEDNPRVAAGQEMPPITGKVEGPSGKHWFKMFWTRQPQFDPSELDLATEYGRHLALEEFCDHLAKLSADDFRITVVEYDVVNE